MNRIRGRRGTDTRTFNYLEILADPEYMTGVKEKLIMITAFNLTLAVL